MQRKRLVTPEKLYLVDGSAYLYRAFHALPALTAPDGRLTGVIFGVANMLRAWIEQHEPQHLAVVFDAPGPTFRHERFADYKANRSSMPDELREQIAPLKTLIKTMGLPLIEVAGVEADDVIGTLCAQASVRGIEVLVSTADKDLAQLVNDQVVLVNTMNDTVLDRAGVLNKFGVEPEQIIDYLALIGDTSDNIPGIPGVGPKTAAKWLRQYVSLNGIVANADAIGGKIGERLREHLEQLPLSHELVTIKTDVELPCVIEELAVEPPDATALRGLLADLGFTRWLETLGPMADTLSTNYNQIKNLKSLEDLANRLKKSARFTFDTETTALDPMTAKLVGLSFSIVAGEAWYVPIAHEGDEPQLDLADVITIIAPILRDPKVAKIAQHSKYDVNVLRRHGFEVNGQTEDTMLMSYVLNPTAGRHDMDSLALRYLSLQTTSFEAIAGKGAKQKTFDQIDLATATHYAAEDADVTGRLFDKLAQQLEREPALQGVYCDIERPVSQVLAQMEFHGVLIDVAELERQTAAHQQALQAITTAAFDLAGYEFNLGSPKQLKQLLFDELGLPVIRKTPSGAASTAEDTLTELARQHRLPALILEHRSLSKLISTYTEKLPQTINATTGRVHTSYQQAVAATGRLSSTDPNLQNIPIRTPAGRAVRRAFIAPDGHQLVAADYSQIELRIMAHLSGDQTLLDAFANGRDIHATTAAEVFDIAVGEVNADQRRAAKAINFGLMYGMSAWGLGRQIEVPRGQAQDYIDRYFERYPGVASFMDATRRQVKSDGYVTTLYGRRLYLPDIKSGNYQRRAAAERAAINAPMQGTAADIIKRAMIQLAPKTQDFGAHMIMQVHDELVFEVPNDQVASFSSWVADAMASAANLDVPLVAEVGSGSNWDDAH